MKGFLTFKGGAGSGNFGHGGRPGKVGGSSDAGGGGGASTPMTQAEVDKRADEYQAKIAMAEKVAQKLNAKAYPKSGKGSLQAQMEANKANHEYAKLINERDEFLRANDPRIAAVRARNEQAAPGGLKLEEQLSRSQLSSQVQQGAKFTVRNTAVNAKDFGEYLYGTASIQSSDGKTVKWNVLIKNRDSKQMPKIETYEMSHQNAVDTLYSIGARPYSAEASSYRMKKGK